MKISIVIFLFSIINLDNLSQFVEKTIKPLTILVKYQEGAWYAADLVNLMEGNVNALKNAGELEIMVCSEDNQALCLTTNQSCSSLYQVNSQFVLADYGNVKNLSNPNFGHTPKTQEVKVTPLSTNYYSEVQNQYQDKVAKGTVLVYEANEEAKLQHAGINSQMLLADINLNKTINYLWTGLISSLVLCFVLLFEYLKYRRMKYAIESQNVVLQACSETQANHISQLEAYIGNFISENRNDTSTIMLKNRVPLKKEKIVFAASLGHYVLIQLSEQGKPLRERITLKELKEELSETDFVQIHKSYLINVAHIKEISSTQVRLSNNQFLPVSRTYKQDLAKVLQN